MTGDAALLLEFYRDKLASLTSHIGAARFVSQYDANNAYQHIINREETHLSWLGRAVVEAGGQLPEAADGPDRRPAGKGAASVLALVAEDVRSAAAFVERWRPRVDRMTNARHRQMLKVVLGETLEQQRFFEQALAGDLNLLGTRSDAVGLRVGDVLPTRWVE